MLETAAAQFSGFFETFSAPAALSYLASSSAFP
jgi:hypothetical protein